MFLVAWPHLGRILNPNWSVLKYTNALINGPLKLIQDFGALGVSFFFLMSGFLLYSNTDSPKLFLIKRIKAIVIPLWCYVGVFALFENIWVTLTGNPTYWTQFSINDWIQSVSLFGFISGQGDVVNGVLWYLVPLFMFWALYWLYIHITISRRWFPFFVDVVIFVLLIADPAIIPIGIKTYSPYVYMPVFGYLIAAGFSSTSRKTKFEIFAIGIVTYMLLVYGFRTKFYNSYYESEPYLPSFFYAFLFFIILLLLEDSFKSNRVINILASSSFAFYVEHSLWGGFIITELYTRGVNFTISFIIGICSCVIISSLSFLTERKVKKWFTSRKSK